MWRRQQPSASHLFNLPLWGYIKMWNPFKKSSPYEFQGWEELPTETALEAGEVPDGAPSLLQQIIDQNPLSQQSAQAGRIQNRIKEVRTERAKDMLEEARRLYDMEKKYTEVREILTQIVERYSDVSEKPSVEALTKAVDQKLSRN